MKLFQPSFSRAHSTHFIIYPNWYQETNTKLLYGAVQDVLDDVNTKYPLFSQSLTRTALVNFFLHTQHWVEEPRVVSSSKRSHRAKDFQKNNKILELKYRQSNIKYSRPDILDQRFAYGWYNSWDLYPLFLNGVKVGALGLQIKKHASSFAGMLPWPDLGQARYDPCPRYFAWQAFSGGLAPSTC